MNSPGNQSSSTARYALVTVPLSVNGYTYGIPPAMDVCEGSLVRVSLGKTRSYNGVITLITDKRPEGDFVIKPITEVLVRNFVTDRQLQLWRWMASYYLCTLGDVLNAALPNCLLGNTYSGLNDTWYDLAEGDDSKLSAPAQRALAVLQASHPMRRADLLKHASATVVQTLVKHQFFVEQHLTRSRFAERKAETCQATLTQAQSVAYESVKQGFAHNKQVLLHGVNSSGKTEIYIRLIQDCLNRGKRALFLVPEIALTTQLAQRLERVFGDAFVAYHSKLSDEERAEIHHDLACGSRFRIVMGVRSAVFLPWNDLGLIVVDEEQESSYKQYEPAPRYNARNVALMMAYWWQVPIVLGSATPLIESFWMAREGRYELVELKERYAAAPKPEVVLVNRADAFKKNLMRGMFSRRLLEAIKEADEQGGQILLFQNRRGFSTSVECPECGWVPLCPKCGISLHRYRTASTIRCHYCGYTQPEPVVCEKCGNQNMKDRGYGTERVVEEFQQHFPHLSVERLDVDAASRKNAYSEILHRFDTHETRVLVGTQMIAKGLDFDGVSLVGVINADNLLTVSDFRAVERAYQLLVQMSGRAGRRNLQGKVVLQASTFDPHVLKSICTSDYAEFYESQIAERHDFNYPPFVRLIRMELRHRDVAQLDQIAGEMTKTLQKIFDKGVLGPEEPAVGKVRNFYLRQFLLKVNPDQTDRQKQLLRHCIAVWTKTYPAVRVMIDVDPV